MDQLLQTLTSAVSATQQSNSPKPFKAPQYSGSGDIDLFISHFQEVTQANRWSEAEAKLHLKLSLSGPAASCIDGTSTEEIFCNLQTRFGLSIRQAKDKLRSIRRTGNQELHELGTEISRLTKLAYPNLDNQDQTEMALDVFSRAIDNINLQRHFLATEPRTLRQAVQSAEEFFQLGRDTRSPRVNNITEEDPVTIHETQVLATIQNSLQKLFKQQVNQQQILDQLQQIKYQPPPLLPPNAPQPRLPPPQFQSPSFQLYPTQGVQQHQLPHPQFQSRPATRPPIACYECQGPHMKRNCPRLQPKERPQTENFQGPAQ